jgi:L-ribulose-5-phosphate 4-epimerase
MTKFQAEREKLAQLHQQLWDAGLVVWSGGNISQRVDGGFLIKPSGLQYDQLTPESMVYCDLDGNLIEGNHAPSSDTAAHALSLIHI